MGMRIGDVMTSDLPSVAPGDAVREAALRMTERNAKALPVCDRGRLVGIVTDWDVTRAVADADDAPQRRVGDYMSTDLVAVAPQTLLTDAADLMAERELHHLLVRDRDRFVGMVHLDVEWSRLGGIESPIPTFAARI
jgi:CBS domain-containing protein